MARPTRAKALSRRLACTLAWAVALSPAVARAQAQDPDSATADSAARADSAQLRRDAERIRAHRRPRPAAGAAGAADVADTARRPGRLHFARPSLRTVAGAMFGTAFVRDDNGTTVGPAAALVLGAEGVAGVGALTALALALRVSRTAVKIEYEGSGTDRDQSAGNVTTLDAVAAVERQLGAGATLRAGLGVIHVRGPDDIAPFRYVGESSTHPLLELGAGVRLPTSMPLRAVAAWQGFRFGAARAADPVREVGLVQRFMVGLTYGR